MQGNNKFQYKKSFFGDQNACKTNQVHQKAQNMKWVFLLLVTHSHSPCHSSLLHQPRLKPFNSLIFLEEQKWDLEL